MQIRMLILASLLVGSIFSHAKAQKNTIFIFDLHDVLLVYDYDVKDWFVMHEVVDVARQLKELGYVLYIASNICEEDYEYVSCNYPEVFGLFDGVYYRRASNNYARKRDETYYSQLQTILCERFGDMRCVIIDDKQKYCLAAQNYGFEAVCFESVEQLWSDLVYIVSS